MVIAQAAGAFGTAFVIGGTFMKKFGVGSAALAANLGFVGAVLAIVAIVVVFLLSEPDWVNWLIDIPLRNARKGSSANHKNLQETLQSLANAQAGL